MATSRERTVPVSTIARLTLDQYDRMIQSGIFDGSNRRRIELIHGELREMSPIGPRHEDVVDVLAEWSFSNLAAESVRIRVQNSIGIPEFDSAPEPDIAWVARKSYSKRRPQPSDVLLVSEVAESSLAYDRAEKAELYATAGAQDYWIVNVPERCIEVFRQPDQGHFNSQSSFSGPDEVSPLAFPQLALKVESLFSIPDDDEAS